MNAAAGRLSTVVCINCIFPESLFLLCFVVSLISYFLADAFNRTIKLYQTVTSLSQKDGRGVDREGLDPSSTAEEAPTRSKTGAFSVKDVLKNPALARLLVLAAKKVKKQREEMP